MNRRSAPRWTIPVSNVFGAGNSPIASGTAGALVAVAVHALAHILAPPAWRWLVDVLALAVILPLGWYASNFAEDHYGKKDDGRVVIDEVAGYWVTMAFLPFSWLTVLVGFILCRILDILKPWPANGSQKLPKGLGIMADDVIAGVYGNILLQIVFRLIFPQ